MATLPQLPQMGNPRMAGILAMVERAVQTFHAKVKGKVIAQWPQGVSVLLDGQLSSF